MKQLGVLAGLIFGLAAMGCQSEIVESTDIRTTGIYADMLVTADGGGDTEVEVKLAVGGKNGTEVKIVSPDKLVATVGDTDHTLTKSHGAYRGTFSGDEGGTEVNIAFLRGEEDDDAPDSYATLPDPFSIDGAGSDVTVSRQESLTVTWDASEADDPMSWDLDGSCLFTSDGSMSDNGELVLQGDDFDATPSAEDNGESCVATLCIERSRNGSLDPLFADNEGGRIRAIQSRCVKFNSAP